MDVIMHGWLQHEGRLRTQEHAWTCVPRALQASKAPSNTQEARSITHTFINELHTCLHTRTQEFRAWVLKKARTKKPVRKNAEERRDARLEKLNVSAASLAWSALYASGMQSEAYRATGSSSLALCMG